MGSLRATRHASPDPCACARVIVQLSNRCSRCFSLHHFQRLNVSLCLARLTVTRRILVEVTSDRTARFSAWSSACLV